MKNLFILLTLVFAPILSQAQGFATVSLQPQARNQYYDYNFGSVPVNFQQSVDFELKAIGTEPTLIRTIFAFGQGFTNASNCPRILMPGRTCTTRVYFWPPYQGFYNGQLRFDLQESQIFINLSGWGRL